MFGWKKEILALPAKVFPVTDLLRSEAGISGIFPLERDAASGAEWRWSDGPATQFTLAPCAQETGLQINLFSKIAGLKISVKVNKREIFSQAVGESGKISELLRVPASSSERKVSIEYSAWNKKGEEYPGDARQLAVGFTYLKSAPVSYFETKICPHPFSQMDIPAYGPFVPCCYTWLNDDYYALESREYYASLHGKHDAWNGPAANALRGAVLAGDYKYCRREICQTKLYTLQEIEDLRAQKEALYPPVSVANARAMENEATNLPEGPAYASITGDPRCNLVCPSCRKEKITKLTPYAEGLLKKTDEALKKFSDSIEVMKMSADGEVFFSSYLRELLRSAGDKARFPRLREVDLITNGILFNQKTFDELRPGTELIKRVAVSVDAGTKEVYAQVRGGDWNKLWENLRWAGEKRKRGDFKDLAIRFVVRKANFRTMPELVRLAEEAGADCVDFSQFVQWTGMAVEDYNEEAVHLPAHPDYRELIAIRDSLLAGSKIRLSMNF